MTVNNKIKAHIAHQQIEHDLDDGVKVNYAKFQGVEVPLDHGKTETMDLLARIQSQFSGCVRKSADTVGTI